MGLRAEIVRRNACVHGDVTSPGSFQIIVAPVANVFEAGLPDTNRLREQGDKVRINLDVGSLNEAVVEAVVHGADWLSLVTAFAEHLSNLRRPFQTLGGESGYVQRMIEKAGEGQVQVRIVQPARCLICDQSPLLQPSYPRFKGYSVGPTQEIEPGHIQRRERAHPLASARPFAS